MSNIFLKMGVFNKSSYVNTSRQNGIAGIENRNLLEGAGAFLFANKVPKYLWSVVDFTKM